MVLNFKAILYWRVVTTAENHSTLEKPAIVLRNRVIVLGNHYEQLTNVA